MQPVSLRLWGATQTVKNRMVKAVSGDSGASEFVAIIVLIAIVIGIGLALGPFKTTILQQFNNVGASMGNIGSV